MHKYFGQIPSKLPYTCDMIPSNDCILGDSSLENELEKFAKKNRPVRHMFGSSENGDSNNRKK